MLLDIVKFGNSILAKRAEMIEQFDEPLKQLTHDMFETMYAANGAGLAAPQVGISKRLFVMDCGPKSLLPRKVVLINPNIIEEQGEQIAGEGCLSVPGFHFDIKRPQRILVKGQDIDGNWITLEFVDYEAQCVSHEIDHLEGRLLITRLSSLKRDLTERKIRKRMKKGNW